MLCCHIFSALKIIPGSVGGEVDSFFVSDGDRMWLLFVLWTESGIPVTCHILLKLLMPVVKDSI